MRRLRRTLGVLGLAVVLALAACGQQPTPSPSGSPGASAPGSPQPGGELVVGLSAEAESMDPHRVYQNAGQSIMHALYDTLLTVAPDGTLGPGLATAWTVVDDTTIEVKLRDGIVFHDGEPLDADAVKVSLYRILDLDLTTDAPIEDQAQRLNSGVAGDYRTVQRVEVVDPLTARLHLSRPDAALPNALGRLFIVPPDYVAEVGNAGIAERPVGTGPFRFVEWRKDDHTTVERNPDYWASPRGEPLVDRVVFRPLLDPSARLNEFTTGGIHVLQDATIDDRAAIEEAGGQLRYLDGDPHHVEIWMIADGGGTIAADPNASADAKQAIEAFAKPEVRRALNLAVDRQTIIDTLLGGLGAPMTHLFVNGDVGFDPSIEPYPYDPDEARRILAEAGYPDGLDVVLDFCTCDRLDPIQAAVDDLREVGVRVTIRQQEIGQFNEGWSDTTNPLRSSRLGFNDPNTFLQLWFKTPPAPGEGGFSLGRYSNPRMDELIDRQAVEFDTEARLDVLHEIGRLSHEDPGAIFLWSSPNLYASGASVEGWEPHFLGYVPVVNVSLTG